MPAIDLHAHTTASDGTNAPAELVRIAKEAGLAAIAVTDHDTLAGIPEAMEAGRRLGVEVVPGVELGAHVEGGELHVLGYFLEPGNAPFEAFLTRMREGRTRRNAAIVSKLNALGCAVTLDDVERAAQVGNGSTKAVGRPHIAQVLVAKGYCRDVSDAFDRFLAHGAAAYVPREKMTPAEAVRVIREAGGVAVCAHPFTLPESGRDDIVRDLAAAGLDGIEVWHSHQSEKMREWAAEIARDLDLVATGGSDYHGSVKPDVHLGTGVDGNVRVDAGVLDELRARRR